MTNLSTNPSLSKTISRTRSSQEHSSQNNGSNLKYHQFNSASQENASKTEANFLFWSNLSSSIKKLQLNTQRQLILYVRKGISDELRAQIWPQLINAPIKSYRCYKTQSARKDIDLDLRRTFKAFSQNKRMQQQMKNVLNALAKAIPQLGYCQGMNFIVGVVLMRLSEQDAFGVCFHILHWLNHQRLLSDLSSIYQILFVLQKLVESLYPGLAEVLRKYEIDMVIYASSWFITLFCSVLPANYSFRVIECFLLEGSKILYRVSLQILAWKKKLLKTLRSIQDIVDHLKDMTEFKEENIDEFFQAAFKISISKNDIQKYKDEYRNIKKKEKIILQKQV